MKSQHPTRSVAELADELLGEHLDLWWSCSSEPFDFGPVFPRTIQRTNGRHLVAFQEALIAELASPPTDAAGLRALQSRVLGGFARFAGSALGFTEPRLELLLDGGLVRVAIEFARAARGFDPDIPIAQIYQAGRNVFTLNALQMLMGHPVALTPSAVGYSLLYPYSDNLLDDPDVPSEDKVAFNARFAQRLSGQPLVATDPLEAKIDLLVSMIEGEYPLHHHPHVWEALRAIHAAQVQSVELVSRDASPYEVDVLGISIDKGGTSVLADGYLVAGDLSAQEARFLFGWGAFLQLADDLQDVIEDREAGVRTIFSTTAGHWPLDALVYRTLHFGQRVLQGMECFVTNDAALLEGLMASSATDLLTVAAGRARGLLTRHGRRHLQLRSRFTFRLLDRRRQRMRRALRCHSAAVPLLMRLLGETPLAEDQR